MAINISIGTPTANSYVSVASANTYFRENETGLRWDSIASSGTLTSTARKENLLKQSTREIDNTYRYHEGKYNKGDRGQDTYQALEFPRDSNVDSTGAVYIPDEVKDACLEQVNWIMQRGQQRTNQNGTIIDPPFFGSVAYNYLRGWINRGIKAVGSYSWQKGL